MNPYDRYRLVARRRRIRAQLAAEVAEPVVDLSRLRRLMRRAREVSHALALSTRSAA